MFTKMFKHRNVGTINDTKYSIALKIEVIELLIPWQSLQVLFTRIIQFTKIILGTNS